MKPATQRGVRSSGDHGSYGSWRRECDWGRTVSVSVSVAVSGRMFHEFVARYNAEWLIGHYDFRSPLDGCAARVDTTLRCAA